MRSRVHTRTLAIALCGALAGSAWGQAAAPPRARSLSEDEFVAELSRRHPRAAIAGARVEHARAGRAAADAGEPTTLSVDREEIFAGDGALPEHFVRLDVPIDLWGRRGKRTAAADQGVAAAEAEAEATRSEQLLDGLELYQEAAYRRARVELLRAHRAQLAAAVELVRKRAGGGQAAGYDADRLDLELAAHDDALASAEADLRVARRTLGARLGEADTLVDASSALELPAVPADVEALVTGGRARRADRRAAERRLEQGRASVAAGDAAGRPGLSLSLGMKSADLGDETAVGYLVGLRVELPWLSPGADAGAGERAAGRALRAEAAAELAALDVEIPAAVRAAHELLAQRVAQAEAWAAGPLAKVDELVRRAEVAYREGGRPLVELLDAYELALDVRMRELTLRRDARLALVGLWRAMGGRP